MFTRSKNIIFTLILAVVLASCSFGEIVVDCTSFTMIFTIIPEDLEEFLEGENDFTEIFEDRTPMIDAYDGEGNLIFDIYAVSDPDDSLGRTYHYVDEDAGIAQLIFNIPYTSPPQANPITARFYLKAEGGDPEVVIAQGVGECNSNSPAPVRTFMDGRINYRDAAAPFAAYGVDGNLHIYWITGDDTGELELIVTAEELADVPEFPESNMLVKANEALGIYVYRLTDGKWQVQARMPNGKLYVLIFEEFHNREYQSMEVE